MKLGDKKTRDNARSLPPEEGMSGGLSRAVLVAFATAGVGITTRPRRHGLDAAEVDQQIDCPDDRRQRHHDDQRQYSHRHCRRRATRGRRRRRGDVGRSSSRRHVTVDDDVVHVVIRVVVVVVSVGLGVRTWRHHRPVRGRQPGLHE